MIISGGCGGGGGGGGDPYYDDYYPPEDYNNSSYWIDVADTSWYRAELESFTITTPYELAGITRLAYDGENFAGQIIYLASNISLAGREWTPIKNFAGTLYGQGYTISGVTVSESMSGENLYGFIKNLQENALISDVKFTDLYVYAPEAQNVGGISGANDHGTIYNCSVNGDVTGYMGVGLIVGGNYGYITNCIANGGTVNSHYRLAGGIAGSSYSTVSDCTSYAYVNGDYEVGGIVGESWTAGGVLTNCEAYGQVSGGSPAGGVAGKIYSSSIISGNKFSSSTGQYYGIGTGSNEGCEKIN
ncbi:MAG: hypothetical protein IJT21_07865 [Synergistaceae bacterium]|nr:hypothetical protein [Synergistaceae bacterium]